MDYQALLPFCKTDRQRQVIRACIHEGSQRKAAKALGTAKSTVDGHVERVSRAASVQGYAPENDMTRVAPDSHFVKGTSTLYDKEGKQALQWVKTSIKHDQLLRIMQEIVDELKTDVKPMAPVALTNRTQLQELLSLYVLTDAHFGMRSWAEETGADWDLEIAERTVLDAFSHLTATSPNSQTGFFLQLGDGLHSDGLQPITPTSGHVLDQDSRFPKVVRTAVRVFRQAIAMLLQKHEKVVVLMAQGNHDLASSVWLQEMFYVLFENNPRVEVVISPSPYYAYVHGKVLLGAHHGHKQRKTEALANMFKDEFRALFGATERTYIHTGHLHQDEVFPSGTTIVERHETLIARDSHSSHGGYSSGRSMKTITYDGRGEIARSTFRV